MFKVKPFIKLVILFQLSILLACAQPQKKETKSIESKIKSNMLSKPNNPYYSNTDTTKLVLEDSVWKRILPNDVYEVSRNADTERPFTGKYWNTEEKALTIVQHVETSCLSLTPNFRAVVAGLVFLNRRTSNQ